MILLYGLVDDPRAARQAWPPGAGRAPEVVAAGALSAVGVRCAAPPEPSADALVAHDAVVTALMDGCSVVPFRFATVIDRPGRLAAAMAGSEDRMAALLQFLRGRVEMAVRASAPPAAPEGPAGGEGPGRSYLRLVRARTRPVGLDRLHRRLAAVSVAAVAEDRESGTMAASYLVGREDVAAFRARAIHLAADIPSVALTSVTGPWAPYSFAAPAVRPSSPVALHPSQGSRRA